MSMTPRWDDTDRGEPKNSEKNLSQCHFVHYKSHISIGKKKLFRRKFVFVIKSFQVFAADKAVSCASRGTNYHYLIIII
jgi:hypothetical protein